MQIKSVKISFDPRKLEKQLKSSIIDNTMEEYTEMVAKTTKSDLEAGKDIYGKKFERITPVTKEIRQLRGFTGTKPLIQSGDMKNSIKSKKLGKNKYAIEANSYGNRSNKNVHQTGFRLSGGIKQEQPYIEDVHYNFSKVGKIPARPWFPDQDSVEGSQTINDKFELIAKRYFNKFNKAFKK